MLSVHEWEIIKLAYDCLKVLRDTCGELLENKRPTCYKVFPLLEMLQMQWKEFCEDAKYIPVHNVLSAGLDNMQKLYCKADDTSMYFISHVLDPTRKLTYVEVAWEYECIESNMWHLQKIVKTSATNEWMDKIINQKGKSRPPDQVATNDPYDELNHFFAKEPLSKQECPDIISWFG
ncbi:hypothetical protein AX15_007781, partial [Amanita polypyramis BW_CC]